jgi:hypothetical protein
MKLSLSDFSSVVTALKSPEEDKNAASELRGATRITVWSRIDAWAGESNSPYSAMMRDISLSGASLLQSVALTAGQSLLIALPRPKTPLSIYCRIMHCRALADGLMAVGICYVKLAGDEVAKQLAQARLKEQARIQHSILQ